MLTADLVRARAKGGELRVTPMNDRLRARAVELAENYLGLLAEGAGQSLGQLRETFAAVPVSPREKKLSQGLIKLIEDELELDTEAEVEPRLLRSVTFQAAARARREHPRGFRREVVLLVASETLGLQGVSIEALDDALYADLKSEKRVRPVRGLSEAELVGRYEVAQYQAVLLRAARVVARVRCRSAQSYRDLFRALKFRRLLCAIEPDGDGYRVEIDGPFSLFESVTKYGLQLALVFPVLAQCDEFEIEADVLWGKARIPLRFRHAGKRHGAGKVRLFIPSEIEELKERIEASGTTWRVEHNERLLELPGIGVIVPDLVFVQGGQRVFFELLGYWSRDAVWKRVELVEAGLPYRVVFAVSTRLRVSEAALDGAESAALYVFKGSLNPKRVLEKVEAVAGTA